MPGALVLCVDVPRTAVLTATLPGFCHPHRHAGAVAPYGGQYLPYVPLDSGPVYPVSRKVRPSQLFEASFPLRTGEAGVANRLRRRIYPPRYAPPEAGGREASFRSLVLRHRKRGSRRTLLAPPPQSAPHPPTPRRVPDESLHPPRFRTSRARPRAFPTNRAKLAGVGACGDTFTGSLVRDRQKVAGAFSRGGQSMPALTTPLASAPREGGVARGVQLSGLVAGEAKRFEQFLRLIE